jgi:hypothetical protein
MQSENTGKDLLANKDDLWALCNSLFRDDKGLPLDLAGYQIDIVDSILRSEHKRVLCWACTRAGKSLAVSIGVILKAAFVAGSKVRIIAPTVDHTKIVMGYVIQHILDHDLLINRLTLDRAIGPERLKQELSKQKITLKKNSDIMILTANILGEGRSLLGFGGTDIIVDEGENIPCDIMKTKVMRMLGDDPNSQIFIIGNPLQKGYMYEKSKDEAWHKIHIGWEECVKAGRLTEAFIMERKAEMTEIEFDIWYNAIYPPESEDTLIPWPWIERARDRMQTAPKMGENTDVYLGVDVASMGGDWCVFTSTERTQEALHIMRDVQKTSKKDTMQTTGRIIQLDEPYNYENIVVDQTGIGEGVVDRLHEQDIGRKVIGFKSSESCEEEKDKNQYLNRKAEMYFKLRKLFESDSIIIMNDPKLLDQLSKMRFEFTSAGKAKIIDPDDHSPDEADSLALSCYAPSKPRLIIDLG